LLVGKTGWDAFQDFPKRKALFFFAAVVGPESRLQRLFLSCPSKASKPLIFPRNKQAFKLGTLELVSLFFFGFFFVLRKLILLICDSKCGLPPKISRVSKRR